MCVSSCWMGHTALTANLFFVDFIFRDFCASTFFQAHIFFFCITKVYCGIGILYLLYVRIYKYGRHIRLCAGCCYICKLAAIIKINNKFKWKTIICNEPQTQTAHADDTYPAYWKYVTHKQKIIRRRRDMVCQREKERERDRADTRALFERQARKWNFTFYFIWFLAWFGIFFFVFILWMSRWIDFIHLSGLF